MPEYSEILSRMQGRGCPAALGGLSGVHQAHLIAAVRRKTGRRVVVLCPDEAGAVRLAGDCAAFAQEEAAILPAREFSFYPVETVSREWEHVRLPILHRALSGAAPIITGSIDAFMQRTLSRQMLDKNSFLLKERSEFSIVKLTTALIHGGYKQCEIVEGSGQFARRGGLLDFFPPGLPHPARVEFFGDEIDSIHSFDPSTQLRLDRLGSVLLLPASETLAHAAPGGVMGLAGKLEGRKQDAERLMQTGSLPDIDKYIHLISPQMSSALDFLDSKTIIFLTEQMRLSERVQNTLWQIGQDIERLLEQSLILPDWARFCYEEAELWSRLEEFECVMLDQFIPSAYPLRPHSIASVTAKQLPGFRTSLDTAAGDIAHCIGGGYSAAVLVPGQHHKEHLQGLLRERGIPAVLGEMQELTPGSVSVMTGSLSSGLEYPAIKLAILTEGQQSAPVKKRKSPKQDPSKKHIVSYTDLSPGDLVVHEHQGIGRFVGIVSMFVDNLQRDYIKINYAGSDSLYVPVTQLNLVSKYIGQGEGTVTRLHKLGGAEWTKARIRAKAAAKDLAKGLIQLQAERKRRPGFAFAPDDNWQKEFEETFEYEETDDQLRCIREIKGDMEQQIPMDRLLCGDVGFGKTEVAFRAVMKCILNGKQAAVLVPTTVLAQQHYTTAVRRFSGYPVHLDVLSRFCTAAEASAVKKHLAMGRIDLVIGTHKLLQKNIKFKNLGLLVVDEEQRFGVTHKERLKELARQVDVLTLTATPIPRTLNMALSGIRDLSIIEEAPRDRYPVQTFVLEYEQSLIFDAIRREIARGGQVYYLHNRIESIEGAAWRVSQALEGVNIAVAHGKMKEQELSEVMRQVVEGEVQVLVCTSIIETGLDIPNVNTLIIEDADRMGLAQLHQIRGRVGRSNRRACAYLTYRRGKILKEDSAKRLSAIRDFAEFGSGLKIAMRDLEIRGAGNILGPEQSGQIISVGYEMYLRLLEEAVLEEQGNAQLPRVECTVDLPIKANIDENYITHAGVRMDFYRRIAALADEDEALELIDELIDRFGAPEQSVHTLTRISLLRTQAASAGISEISQKSERLIFKIAIPDFAKIAALCALPEYKGRILFSAGKEPYLSLRLQAGRDVIEVAGALIGAYSGNNTQEGLQ